MNARTANEFIVTCRDLVSQILGEGILEEYVSDVCISWGKVAEFEELDIKDKGISLALKLRKNGRASTGIMRKFLATFLTLTPHSMATERAVSHYNNVKSTKRASLKQETINGIMHVSLNGKGTAHFDPRQAVYEFLKQKDRRNREPRSELYQERDFVKKFFKSDNGCL